MTEDYQEEDLTDKTIGEEFNEKFDRPMPDMVVGLTAEGFVNAVSAQMVNDKLIPEDQRITGMVTNIDFGPEGYLPLGLYLEKIPDDSSDEIPSRLN